jgi:hypothetical protein
MTIEYTPRESRWLSLNERLHGKNAFVQVTEWSNGDGWDVETSTNLGRQIFSLDHDLIDKINHLLTAPRMKEELVDFEQQGDNIE